MFISVEISLLRPQVTLRSFYFYFFRKKLLTIKDKMIIFNCHRSIRRSVMLIAVLCIVFGVIMIRSDDKFEEGLGIVFFVVGVVLASFYFMNRFL